MKARRRQLNTKLSGGKKMNRKLNKGYALAMAAVLGISVVPGGSYVMAAGDGAAAEENAAAENAYFHSENADEVKKINLKIRLLNRGVYK